MLKLSTPYTKLPVRLTNPNRLILPKKVKQVTQSPSFYKNKDLVTYMSFVKQKGKA